MILVDITEARGQALLDVMQATGSVEGDVSGTTVELDGNTDGAASGGLTEGEGSSKTVQSSLTVTRASSYWKSHKPWCFLVQYLDGYSTELTPGHQRTEYQQIVRLVPQSLVSFGICCEQLKLIALPLKLHAFPVTSLAKAPVVPQNEPLKLIPQLLSCPLQI
ncbi:hypothetical protein NE237_027535 [Protea cynaroides]|uniref:Uncharacterized protein n=1 Tax=Protea cynaroides TaxID=273540 RepID=A0A9Q0JUH4_9MAGN|nr:hypothetical protein NE237_027535 [Protea cynaroides]